MTLNFFKTSLLLFAAACAPSFGADNNIVTSDLPNSIELVAQDMRLPHEAKLRGVPVHFDWYKGPRINMGLTPRNFTAMTAWGQVYEAAQGNIATNTRVELRNIKSYYLSASDRHWHLLQTSRSVEGNAFTEDYAGNINFAADIRPEAGGGISVTVGNGLNFHFWPAGDRASLPPVKDLAGIFTTVQARLIVDDTTKPDDRARARILVGMGGDYWRNINAQWAPNYANNNDIAIGRHRYVKTGWQSFNMTTMSLTELQKFPPPLR
jgi:hypothetical protein